MVPATSISQTFVRIRAGIGPNVGTFVSQTASFAVQPKGVEL